MSSTSELVEPVTPVSTPTPSPIAIQAKFNSNLMPVRGPPAQPTKANQGFAMHATTAGDLPPAFFQSTPRGQSVPNHARSPKPGDFLHPRQASRKTFRPQGMNVDEVSRSRSKAQQGVMGPPARPSGRSGSRDPSPAPPPHGAITKSHISATMSRSASVEHAKKSSNGHSRTSASAEPEMSNKASDRRIGSQPARNDVAQDDVFTQHMTDHASAKLNWVKRMKRDRAAHDYAADEETEEGDEAEVGDYGNGVPNGRDEDEFDEEEVEAEMRSPVNKKARRDQFMEGERNRERRQVSEEQPQYLPRDPLMDINDLLPHSKNPHLEYVNSRIAALDEEAGHAGRNANKWDSASQKEWEEGGRELLKRFESVIQKIVQLSLKKALRHQNMRAGLEAYREELREKNKKVEGTGKNVLSWASEIFGGGASSRGGQTGVDEDEEVEEQDEEGDDAAEEDGVKEVKLGRSKW